MEEQPIDIGALRAKLDSLGARGFLPEGLPNDPPLLPADDDFSFDWTPDVLP